MSQGTPRKFSEKIAILERKQNEEQDMFLSVMRDVRAITNKPTGNTSANTAPEMSQQAQPASGPGYSQQIDGSMTMAGTSNTKLTPDALHPLSMNMNWNRPGGGSLPNVHAMLQQQQQQINSYNYPDWNGWQMPNAAGHNIRTRSPGAHYHPYMNNRSAGSPRQSEQRITQMGTSPNMHLQLPSDPSWSKARSDPAIHTNCNFASSVNNHQGGIVYPGAQQWIPDYNRMNHLSMGQSPQTPTIPFIPFYPGPNPVANFHMLEQQQQMQQSSNSSQNHLPANMTDMAVGSLPNMHASLALSHQRQQEMKYGVLPTTSECQPMHRNNPGPGNQSLGRVPMPNFSQQQQLSTPAPFSQSQSAPTSPAQTTETPLVQQWPPTRHFSASPDVLDVPNICVTGADGSENLDCFQDLQDLHLDNEIQRLLREPSGEQVDPVTETQLLN